MLPRKSTSPPVSTAVRGAGARGNPSAACSTIPAVTPATRWPETRAARGLVATPHALASAAGVAALRRGGNALDAAVAAATTIAVVYPHMNSIGGDNVWLLIPSMYLVDGRPRLVYGTMGGDGQPQTQAALVIRAVDCGLGPYAAVEAPRWLFGRTWGEVSRSLRLEGRFAPDVGTGLRRRGHEVEVVEDWSDLMGHAQVIRLDPDGLAGGSDPRADGAALGW